RRWGDDDGHGEILAEAAGVGLAPVLAVLLDGEVALAEVEADRLGLLRPGLEDDASRPLRGGARHGGAQQGARARPPAVGGADVEARERERPGCVDDARRVLVP